MHAHIRRLIFLALLTGAAPLIPVLPAHAQQVPMPQPVNNPGLPDFLSRWFPQWFGEEETGPRPEDTLQAPFADPDAVKEDKEELEALERSGVIYQSSDGNKYRVFSGEAGRTYALPEYNPNADLDEGGALDKPHRRPEHLADWLVRATSEIFTVEHSGYEKHLKHLATGMSEAGLAEFQKFMADSKILPELQSQPVKLMGYVEEPPLLLNEGVLNGRYRWLFEMPVTVTFLPRDMSSYKDVEDPTENTLRFIVQAQVGRVEKGPSEDNVVIETWRVRSGEPEPAKKTP